MNHLLVLRITIIVQAAPILCDYTARTSTLTHENNVQVEFNHYEYSLRRYSKILSQ